MENNYIQNLHYIYITYLVRHMATRRKWTMLYQKMQLSLYIMKRDGATANSSHLVRGHVGDGIERKF